MAKDKKATKHIAGGAAIGATVGAASPLARPLGRGFNAALDNFSVSKKMGIPDPEISRAMLKAGKDRFSNALIRRPGPYVKRGLAGLTIGGASGFALSVIRKKKVQESALGWWQNIKKIKTAVPDAVKDIRTGIKEELEQTAKAQVDKYGPEVKRAAKKFVLGVGGASLIGAGTGSYIGNKAAMRKKKIKESNPMLFPFAVGIHAALAKTRGGEPNCLIQENVAENVTRVLGAGKRYKSSVLSPEKLGEAMHKNAATMNQAFRLYGSDSKTLKRAFPRAFGVNISNMNKLKSGR